MNEIDKKIYELKDKGLSNNEIASLLELDVNFVKRRFTKVYKEILKRKEIKLKKDNEFVEKVKEYLPYSNSMNALCSFLGLKGVKGYYDKIQKVIEEHSLSTEHFGSLVNNSKKTRNKYNALSDEEYFQYNVERNGVSLLKRLIEHELKENKCEICGLTSWNNKPITLQVHHINGNHCDNRLENLQILCPNCHSQTDSYAQKKKVKKQNNEVDIEVLKKQITVKTDIKNFCLSCHKEITKDKKFCSQMCYNNYKKKFSISKEEMIESLKMLGSFRKVGKKYGVSDNAIRKRCITEGIFDEALKYVSSKKR